MKTSSKYLYFLLIILISFSCAHKRYTKKAAEFESKGMYNEASDYYYQAISKKPDYIEAELGLKRTGQRVIDKMYGDFMTAYNQGNNKQAVYHYLEAKNFEEKLNKVKIKLVVPPYYEEYYNEVKGSYLDDQYFEATKKLNNEDFKAAERIFREINKIDPNYKDTQKKLNIAIYEPKYREAVASMGNKKYRTAYYQFDKILKKQGSYKDAEDLKNQCKIKGTVKIAISPIKNYSKNKALASQVKSKIISGLNNSNNPFIKVIEMPKNNKGKSSVQPDAIIKSTIHSISIDLGKMSKDKKRGYIEKREKYKDSQGYTQTRTTYDKVNYYEYKLRRSATIKYDMSMVDTRTNEILTTKNYNSVNTDQIHYAKYEGNSNALIPGYWKNKHSHSQEDIIKNNYKDKQHLQQLLKSRREIKTTESLINELVDEISSKTVRKILDYNPEK